MIVDEGRRFVSMRVIGRGVSVAPALKSGIGLTFLLALLGTGARIVIPILLQLSIDHGLTENGVDIPYILRLCLIGLLCVVGSSIALRAATQRLGSRAELGLFILRRRLFDHIHRLSIEDHNNEKRGALVSRVTSDIETLTQFFSWGGLGLLLDGSQMIAVAAVMLAYDWRLALVVFITSAPLLFVLRFVQSRLVRAHNQSRERNADFLGVASEMIAGAETLRAYNASGPVIQSVRQSMERRRKSNVKAGVIGAFLFPSGEVFAVFTVMAVVAAGLIIGPAGGLTSGALVGFVFLTYRFLEPIAEFTEIIDQLQSAVAGLRRVLGILDTPIGPKQSANPVMLPRGLLSIDLHEVSFAYSSRIGTPDDDDAPVLHHLSMHIPAGQHVALVGPSGSGKTTVARLIARLTDPTFGSVKVGGVDLTKVANSDLRSRLIVVPQEPFLFAETILYNLQFVDPTADEHAILDAFNQLGLLDWIQSLPDGLNTHVGQRGASLSAGERQLVSLARAALVDPAVLILDEATSSLDPGTEAVVERAMDALMANRTTIVIAHRLTTAARCDRIGVVAEGRLAELGTHDELVAAQGHYASLHSAWTGAQQ